ncbi:MAG: universal stress protein [Halobacteriaceae archaeon]
MTDMFERILVAVDGTVPASNAADHAAGIASAFDARLDIVHVLEGDAALGDPRDRGAEIIDEAAAPATERGVTVESYLLDGRPPRAIADHAAANDIDLGVMGRHGRSGAGERLLGTVTDRVLRTVDIPVLAVGATDTPTDYEAVLVPTDGSDAAERALPYGEDIADAYGAGLHVLTVVDVESAAGVFDAGGISGEFVDRLTAKGQDAVDRLADAVTADLEVTQAVVRGTPHEEIGGYATDHGIDLVVMGSTGASSLTGQALGSVANRVLRTVQVPVLVVSE